MFYLATGTGIYMILFSRLLTVRLQSTGTLFPVPVQF
jgi:hypothetical protein